jgi:hypothetical protein
MLPIYEALPALCSRPAGLADLARHAWLDRLSQSLRLVDLIVNQGAARGAFVQGHCSCGRRCSCDLALRGALLFSTIG